MAKMIPNVLKKEDFHGSYGEEAVYDALRSLPEDYTVFHSVHWNKRNVRGRITWGESDFTVFHPKKGLIVIEVKSGGISCSDGKWTQTNTLTGEVYDIKDPLVQAERSKFAFVDLLDETDDSYDRYYVEAAVWFPSVKKRAFIGNLPPAYASGNVLTANDLKTPLKSITRIYDHYCMFVKHHYREADAENVMRILAPRFEATPDMMDNIVMQDNIFLRLTNEQSYLLDYLEEQKTAVIEGGAGTGKTMLAIEKARRLATRGNVLFLCFNKYLNDHLREVYSPIMPNVHFYNLPGLVCKQKKILEVRGDEEITDYLDGFYRYPWPYQDIIIDEGQDFAEKHVELLSVIAEMKEGCFYVFYDKNQLVQQRHHMDFVKTIESRYVLSTNCRNTKSIAVTANVPIGIDDIKMRMEIMGQKPNFYVTRSYEKIPSIIADIIRGYIDNGLTRRQIVILTVKTEDFSILKEVKSIGGHAVTDKRGTNGIFFTTARKFKGLESDVVILVDIDESIFSTEEARRVTYVGASRAKHHLDIVSVLDDVQLKNLGETLSGRKVKDMKSAIEKHFKVKMKIVDG